MTAPTVDPREPQAAALMDALQACLARIEAGAAPIDAVRACPEPALHPRLAGLVAPAVALHDGGALPEARRAAMRGALVGLAAERYPPPPSVPSPGAERGSGAGGAPAAGGSAHAAHLAGVVLIAGAGLALLAARLGPAPAAVPSPAAATAVPAAAGNAGPGGGAVADGPVDASATAVTGHDAPAAGRAGTGAASRRTAGAGDPSGEPSGRPVDTSGEGPGGRPGGAAAAAPADDGVDRAGPGSARRSPGGAIPSEPATPPTPAPLARTAAAGPITAAAPARRSPPGSVPGPPASRTPPPGAARPTGGAPAAPPPRPGAYPACLAASLGRPAPAAEGRRAIGGRVVDARCAPVDGAIVVFASADGAVEILARTEHDGTYVMSVEPGAYRVGLDAGSGDAGGAAASAWVDGALQPLGAADRTVAVTVATEPARAPRVDFMLPTGGAP